MSIVGVMLFFAAIELGKFMLTLVKISEIVLAVVIGVISFLTNLAVGFSIGLIAHFLITYAHRLRDS